MQHYEVICPVCAGNFMYSRCPFACTGTPKPRVQKVESLHYYYRMTCLDCISAPECEFAWDWYNTNGDCLAMK